MASLNIDLDASENRVTIWMEGELSPAALQQAAAHVMSEYPGVHRLWDLRAASLSGLSREALTKLAQFAKSTETRPGETRSAILVSRAVDYGIGRMYQMLGETVVPVAMRVFRDEAEARSWLDDSTDTD